MKTMNRHRWSNIAILALFVCGLSAAVRADYQRMAIPKGIYSIPASGSRPVDAYCLDFTRESPSRIASYTNILTSADSAFVRIGRSAPIPLQQAIVLRDITIQGTVIGTLERAIEIMGMRRGFENRPPLERALIEIEAEGLIGQGDFTTLVFVNHTNQPLTLTLDSNIAVGSPGDTEPIIDPKDLRLSKGTSQTEVWRRFNIQHQQLLKATGYYRGRISGSIDTATERAIHNFKSANKLIKPTDTAKQQHEIDKKVEEILKYDADRISVSRKYQTATPMASVITIENFRGKGSGVLYKAYSSDRVLYSGNSGNALSRTIAAKIRTDRSQKPTYLVMQGFSNNDLNTFSTTFKIASPNVKFLFTGQPNPAIDSFFRGGKTFAIESISEPISLKTGSQPEVYSADFNLTDANKKATRFRILSYVRDKLSAVSQRFRSLLTEGPQSAAPSLAEIVAKACTLFPDEKFMVELTSIDSRKLDIFLVLPDKISIAAKK